METLDCKGLSCPEPVIRCRNLVQSKVVNELKVIVDNGASLENVSRFLVTRGYKVNSEAEGKNWNIYAQLDCEATMEAVENSAQEKTLVFITTETLGKGSDELGTKLMESFLSTLKEMNGLWRIVLLNGGVKLAAKQGNNLVNLQVLEALGIDILVCGACLTYYDLLDKKQVGQTTNMLDVVTSMTLAEKVIHIN